MLELFYDPDQLCFDFWVLEPLNRVDLRFSIGHESYLRVIPATKCLDSPSVLESFLCMAENVAINTVLKHCPFSHRLISHSSCS